MGTGRLNKEVVLLYMAMHCDRQHCCLHLPEGLYQAGSHSYAICQLYMVSTEKPRNAQSAGRETVRLAKQRLAKSVSLPKRSALSTSVPFASAIWEHVVSHTETMNAEVHTWEVYFWMCPSEAFCIDSLTPAQPSSMAFSKQASASTFFQS